MDTKEIEIISIDQEEFNKLASEIRGNLVDSQIDEVNNWIVEINKSLQNIFKNSYDWIKIKNKDVYYNNSIYGLFPNFKNFELGYCTTYFSYDETTFKKKFSGNKGQLIELNEFQKCFAGKISKLNSMFGWELEYTFTIEGNNGYTVDRDGRNSYKWSGNYRYDSYHIPVRRFTNKNDNIEDNSYLGLMLLFAHKLIPEGLSNDLEIKYKNILKLIKNDKSHLYYETHRLSINRDIIIKELNKKTIDSISGESLKMADIINKLKEKMPIPIDESLYNILENRLLNCDKVRADIESYDKKILSDPNRGHWDLWDKVDTDAHYTVSVNDKFMARNPIADVKDNGVIGIDFGTKSTVVVYQEDSDHTLPMRIGTGKLSKKVEASHYENPTVMEFVDITNFLKKYNEKDGRPETLWEHLTTSHTAFSSLINSDSKEFYSYLNELKQWAGDKGRQIRLRDKMRVDKILPEFLNIKDDEFNPIELYAYYIGLYINNMHNGIYLDYLLSFPVTYEKSVREKIIDSFTKGIKKSFPIPVLNNKEAMAKFRVSAGASEPAAYAICALQQYGFEPVDDEKVFYGVFDFGGGTTDFDFGLWREAGHNERKYDYVIESFGAGGDKYLGGENLLELLAFEVFKSNQDKLRNEGITFILPPECKRFLGSEVLISESQEAKINTTQLVEKLRPFWEKHEGYDKTFETGIIKVNLFNKVGEAKLNFELSINSNELEEIINNRIDKGIRNFFDSLRTAFNLPKDTDDVNFLNIFLAGNSSRSPVVNELFQKYIEEFTNQLCEEKGERKNFFKVFPPLGTAEAIEIQKEKEINLNEYELECPTGKTGVAFGLIESRLGGRIKLISERTASDEIKFQYFIGYEKKKCFKVISDREIKYNEWIYFMDASDTDFTLYYTSLPEAFKGTLNIKEVKRKNCRINNPDENANIYYRAISPTVLEYVVSTDEKIKNNNYNGEIIKLELS